jgi:hypothetical protein
MGNATRLQGQKAHIRHLLIKKAAMPRFTML